MNPVGQPERRKYKRIHKNFIVNYFDLASPDSKYQASQLKNISLGGMCLITEKTFAPANKLGLELKTPFLVETSYLEGVVLESHERIKGIIYETRIQFLTVTPQTEFVLNKLIEHFGKEESA